jgi:hypothetical protein
MGVNDQRHAPAALYLRGKVHRYSLDRRLGGPESRSGHRGQRNNSLASVGDRTPAVQSVDTILSQLPKLPILLR